jgi:hypothetical protein
MNLNNKHFLFLLLGTFFFTACEEPCTDPDTDYLNGIFLEFKLGGEDGYTNEELNEAYVVRYYANDVDTVLPVDTIFLNGIFYENTTNKLRLSNNFPIKNSIQPYWVIYDYTIQNPEQTFVIQIKNIDVKGNYTGDCIYENQLKTYTVNDSLFNRTGNSEYLLIDRNFE